jgi:hypothetical protein
LGRSGETIQGNPHRLQIQNSDFAAAMVASMKRPG